MTDIDTLALYRRLRNRIIEHLELVSSDKRQLSYQQAVPAVHVSNELFNGWGDWVLDAATIDAFTEPVFTPEEQQAIRQFNSTLDAVALKTPQNLPYIVPFVGTSAWQELSSSASNALAVFMLRGMGRED
jgi:hypothetical protein